MSAYCFFNVQAVHDEARMDIYRASVFPTVAAHGGRYVLIGGRADVVEGRWSPGFPVMIEFPDLATAHRWYQSPEYQAILPHRLAATTGEAVFMEGMEVPAPEPAAAS